MKTIVKLALLSALSCGAVSAALVTTTTFDGTGALTGDNWDNGTPTNANPGLLATTSGISWLGTAWTDTAVRQTGGTVFAADNGDFSMRGGALDSGLATVYEIDDTANSDFNYKNLEISGMLTMWRQYAGNGGHELSLLNGYADIDTLNAVTSADVSTINILNGKLDIASVSAAKVSVNMLSGGTGEIVVDDRNGALLNSMRLDFASDSLASFTILQNGGSSSYGYWEFYVEAGFASIDGITVTDLSQFDIQNIGGLSTTISMIPEPSSAALLAGMMSFGLLAICRR